MTAARLRQVASAPGTAPRARQSPPSYCRNRPPGLSHRDPGQRRHPLSVSAPSDSAVDFRSLLCVELEHAGLLPDLEQVRLCRRDVTRIGAEEAAALAGVVGAPLWVQALDRLGRPCPQADSERVLGFGTMLTAFMLPPVRIDEALSREVLTLGAHANLLVGLFDLVADECPDAALPLSRALVEEACAGRGRIRLAWRAHTGTPVARLLTRMLSGYVRRLDRLPYAGRHGQVRALQSRAILAMHDAELRTLGPASGVTDRVMRRKSALPFVVMGMAGWLAVEWVPPPAFRAHLRWLYRVGSFLGWIDDAADLGADLAAGRPNRVATALAREGNGSARDDAERLARAIASAGTRIMAERMAALPSGHPGAAAGDVLPTVVLSWLDAIPR